MHKYFSLLVLKQYISNKVTFNERYLMRFIC